MYKICGGKRGRLKEDSILKVRRAKLHIDIAGDCPGIELSTQSLELLEKFCYLSNIRGARDGAVASVLPRIRRR